MKKFIVAASIGFFINNLVATLIAMIILNPLLNASFSGTVRTEQQGLHFHSLLSGYLLLSIIMAWMYPKINFRNNWVINGLVFGTTIGAIVFLSGHLIVAGWSIIPATPMFISGVLDCLSTIATGLFIAFIYNDGKT